MVPSMTHLKTQEVLESPGFHVSKFVGLQRLFEAGGNYRFPAIWDHIYWRSGQCCCVVEQHPWVSWRKWNAGWHDEERKFGGDFLMEFEFPELNEFSLVFFEKTVGLNLALTLISTSRTGPCPCPCSCCGCDFAYESYKPKFLWRTWEHLQKAPFFLKLKYRDYPPPRIPVTTRSIIFLVGGSQSKPSFCHCFWEGFRIPTRII